MWLCFLWQDLITGEKRAMKWKLLIVVSQACNGKNIEQTNPLEQGVREFGYLSIENKYIGQKNYSLQTELETIIEARKSNNKEENNEKK